MKSLLTDLMSAKAINTDEIWYNVYWQFIKRYSSCNVETLIHSVQTGVYAAVPDVCNELRKDWIIYDE